ncbi:unnamed protein product [Polarella glacialis]|uniref:Uncharacterized protein n=1 Tax=Polarella glacialis TaxID=89957 RepID=A0A813IKR0_POLGL|nr:unnamed protein product [Polarella glacialis]
MLGYVMHRIAFVSVLAVGLAEQSLRGLASTQAAEPTACESAFFRLTSEDSCGGEDGPSADKACSPTCKPLACQFVAACKPAGSNITFEDENGETQTIPADGVQDMVAVLQSEHVSCPCTGEANVPSEKNWSEPQLHLFAALNETLPPPPSHDLAEAAAAR